MTDYTADSAKCPSLQNFKRRLTLLLATLAACVGLAACKEQTVALDILAYNHGPAYIYTFDVNGAMGPGVGPVKPGGQLSGGGGTTCCVVLPAKWRPGLKAHIVWYYSRSQTDPNPIPPPREADVEIPEYGPDPENGDFGNFFVHFYPNHQIRVVINRFRPGYPGSPDPDLSPVATGTLLKETQPTGDRK